MSQPCVCFGLENPFSDCYQHHSWYVSSGIFSVHLYMGLKWHEIALRWQFIRTHKKSCMTCTCCDWILGLPSMHGLCHWKKAVLSKKFLVRDILGISSLMHLALQHSWQYCCFWKERIFKKLLGIKHFLNRILSAIYSALSGYVYIIKQIINSMVHLNAEFLVFHLYHLIQKQAFV